MLLHRKEDGETVKMIRRKTCDWHFEDEWGTDAPIVDPSVLPLRDRDNVEFQEKVEPVLHYPTSSKV